MRSTARLVLLLPLLAAACTRSYVVGAGATGGSVGMAGSWGSSGTGGGGTGGVLAAGGSAGTAGGYAGTGGGVVATGGAGGGAGGAGGAGDPDAVTEMALGTDFSCALHADGRVSCWGSDIVGQLGRHRQSCGSGPELVANLTGVARIAAGTQHACAALRDGRAVCWGSNTYGQLGVGDTVEQYPFPLVVRGLTAVVELALGDQHSCARLADGTVRCWGNNRSGELGDGTTLDRSDPVTVAGLSGVVELAVGHSHACARLGDGSVRCWGTDHGGQLGRGAKGTFSALPVEVPGVRGAVQIAAGAAGSCVRLEGGGVTCWGQRPVSPNSSGSVADGPTPVPGVEGAVQVAAGQGTCARIDDGTVRCWGYNFGVGESYLWQPVPVADLAGALDLYVGQYHACVRVVGGGVRCWGFNNTGQLGDGSSAFVCSPRVVPGVVNTAAVAVGNGRVCVLGRDGGGLSCWGNGFQVSSAPTSKPLLDPSGAVALAVGHNHVCVRGAAGTVECQGNNSYGQLGDGSTTMNPPGSVSVVGLAGVTDLALGADHSCARAADGTVSCWGLNASGQLGRTLGGPNGTSTPGPVPDLANVVQIAARESSSCALLASGAVRCWGGADVVMKTSPSPAVVEVAVGQTHACVRLASGAVACAGRGEYGQLGTGVSTGVLQFTSVRGLTGVRQIACGTTHTCALLADQTVACWGENRWGQLGDGTTGDRNTPQPVPGLAGVVELSLGNSQSCARLADGSVACWGSNQQGMLGVGGDFAAHAVPAWVPGLR